MPILLDLFGGQAGGAARGYHEIGFDVISVDILPAYPGCRVGESHVMDWRDGLRRYGSIAHVVHASPPCQRYTSMSAKHRGQGTLTDKRPHWIPEVQEALRALGKPYVIENVTGARKHLHSPTLLRGSMFGLGVDRPRLFETNWPMCAPSKPYPARSGPRVGVYGKLDGRRLWTRADGTELRAASSIPEAAVAMGWPDYPGEWRGLAESIPPAYTRWIGACFWSWVFSDRA